MCLYLILVIGNATEEELNDPNFDVFFSQNVSVGISQEPVTALGMSKGVVK